MEIKNIQENQNKAIKNLNNIISLLSNYQPKENKILKQYAKDFLNYNIDEETDRQMLIQSLTAIRNDLSTMTRNDYSVSDTGKAYVRRSFKNSEYEKTMWIPKLMIYASQKNDSISMSSPLDAILVHETSHKVLNTIDILYFSKGDILNDLDPIEKRLNADNWTGFYQALTCGVTIRRIL